MGNLVSSQQQPRSAKGKVVLITGCSKGGLGYALASEFGSRGATVYATSRNTKTMLGLENSRIHLLPMDVTSDKSIKEAVAKVASSEGRIDILVNNAGIAIPGPAADTPRSIWQKVFETNVMGTAEVTRAVFPHMAAQHSGRILNIGSVAGVCHRPWDSVYCSSKAAVRAMSNCMRMEMKPFGVDVVLVEPGYISTNIFSTGLGNFVPLAKDSLYLEYEPVYKKHFQDSAADKTFMTAEKFANDLADVALKPKAPWRFVTGSQSTAANLIASFPTWLKDPILWRGFGVLKEMKTQGKLRQD